jgi:hypothetical protein
MIFAFSFFGTMKNEPCTVLSQIVHDETFVAAIASVYKIDSLTLIDNTGLFKRCDGVYDEYYINVVNETRSSHKNSLRYVCSKQVDDSVVFVFVFQPGNISISSYFKGGVLSKIKYFDL